MSNWYKESNNSDNGSKKQLSIETDISSIIPDRVIKDYQIEEIWLTTFSLEYDQLSEILYGLDALKLVSENKVHVFYDMIAKCQEEDDSQIISYKNLHAVKLDNFAFHPKVILCRYAKSVSEIRYVIIVSSKNITNADNLDAYAVAYGDVSSTEEKPNGEKVADYMKNIVDKLSFDELKKVDFKADNISDIHFLNARDVFDEINEKKGLIVVSPFLSDGFFPEENKKMKNPPALILSTEEGFSKLDENRIFELLNKNKCRVYDGLHAKIYCYKYNEKTHWIIGSSNATNNGCNVIGKSGNIEFNIGFATAENDYDCFKELLENQFGKYDIGEYQIDKSNNNKFNAREIFNDIVNKIGIECTYKDKECIYTCSVDFSEVTEKNVEFYVPGADKKKDNNTVVVFSGKKPMSQLIIKISKDEQTEKFALSLYGCSDKYTKDKLDKKCKVAYAEMLERIQNQIIAGKSKRNISLKSRASSGADAKNNVRHEKINKEYAYEKILNLAYRYSNSNDFANAIKEVKKYAEIILSVDKNNPLQNSIKDLVEKIK